MSRRRNSRRGGGGDDGGDLRWLVTYSDVITLMMAFFVMLYAISQVDQQKFEAFVSGLQDPFDNPTAREGLLSQGSGIVGASALENEPGDPAVEGLTVVDGFPQKQDVPPPPDPTEEEGEGETLPTLAGIDALSALREAIIGALDIAGIPAAADLNFDTRGLVVSIATDEVLFASGASAISPQGMEIIDVIAPILQEFDNQILVEGHTDNVPLNQGGYTNWDLSADRALALLKVLEGQHGISPVRLAATGYGEHRTKATNETEEGRALNRRVELVIVADLGGTSDE